MLPQYLIVYKNQICNTINRVIKCQTKKELENLYSEMKDSEVHILPEIFNSLSLKI